jgi:hypothetical protein
VFESVVVVVFQSVFARKCIKIIFFILKKLFLTSTHQNDLKIKKNIKNNNFFKTQKQPAQNITDQGKN